MARWLKQTIEAPKELTLKLESGQVELRQGSDCIFLRPHKSEEAHDLALAFRKAARRLEEIGRGLE